MKRIYKLATICVVVAASAIGWYFYRWGNYGRRPIFFNTFAQTSETLDPWRWKFNPPPISDAIGRVMIWDFFTNTVVIVNSGDPHHGAIEVTKATEEELDIIIGAKAFTILKKPNVLLEIDDSGYSVVRPLAIGEARFQYDATVHSNEEVNMQTVKLVIDKLLLTKSGS